MNSFVVSRAVRGNPFRATARRYISDLQRRERTDNLNRMGFSTYQKYLNSDLWKKIRSQVLERDNHKCCRCGELATQVHHSQYDYATLKGEHLLHLQSSCGNCHLNAGHNRGRMLRLKDEPKKLKQRRLRNKKKGRKRKPSRRVWH